MRTRLLSCCFAATLAACSSGAQRGQTETTDTALKNKPAPQKVPQSDNPYTLFESLQVRPLALSPSGKLLFAANTPDNRLEVFKVEGRHKLTPVGSVKVGLEPVAVAARNDDEVWVVNHLSDSVSIVDVSEDGEPRVTRTLLVGDEPRDIVFGGAHHERAFITTAHRGQNTGDAYDLQSPGVGRADVWVFDALHLGDAAGGNRLAKLTFFADTPRALAVSADGKTVYAAAFNSGNQTSAVSPEAVKTMYKGVMPGPAAINLFGQLIPQPPTGLVVKYQNGHWLDAYGTNFDAFVKVKLPDQDVFAIDATANPPAQISNGAYAHVGTTLFNMAVNPKSGKVYVTNTDAHNDIRFEGHTAGFSSVRGHITDSRVTVIDPASGAVSPVDLNPHVDFNGPGGDAEKALSVAFPLDVVVSADGATLYTVAQGSSKLAVYKTADLDAGAVTPSASNYVTLSGGGPTGLAVDAKGKTAYVLNRFDDSISIVDLKGMSEVGKVALFDPEPASVTAGRKYLYDANLTSSHGTTACASCHIGGDKDELAWDLGNPGGIPLTITKLGDVFTISPQVVSALLPAFAPIFGFNMPVKGPMTTQSLRGMDNHGAMHWRGDRNGAINQDGSPVIDPATNQPIVSAQPNAGLFDEVRAFTSFNVAFPGLVGNPAMLSDSDMLDFANFILQVSYPPNPVRNLDNSLTPEQQIGYGFFFNHATLPDGSTVELPSDRFHNCNGCHTLNPQGNAGLTKHPGFFGTDGRLSFELETQVFKVPHLRNLYTKVGMFGSSPDSLQPGTIVLQQGPATDQIRGFGFNHDGVLGQLEHFFTGQVFLKATSNVTLPDGTVVPPNPYGIPFIDINALFATGKVVFVEDGGFALRHAIVAFMMAFDTNHAPIVGQQITLTGADAATANPRIDLLEARAAAGEADLVVSGHIDGKSVEYVYASGAFVSSTQSAPITDAQLRALVKTGGCGALTFTAVPVGSGWRVGVDRDGDGYTDADEVAFGTDPANAASHP
jgi:DNA-binding beta-propeller fold protein YncE